MNMEYIYNRLIECECTVLEISRMSKNEMFEYLLNYEGLIGYDYWIKSLVKDLYGITIE